jgi:hypothetical protein
MLLREAHPIRRAYQDREVRRLLDQTEDALVLSEGRLRQSSAGLSKAREQNAQHRRTSDELREALGVL